jgi:hypothetical protein
MNAFRRLFLIIWLLAHLFGAEGQSVSGIVNNYYKVTAINPATNQLTVASTAGLQHGTRVMIIQMKGAGVNNTNTAAFGDITVINQAGNYEINTICDFTATTIFLHYQLLKTYNTVGYVQLVTIPRYTNVTVSGLVQAAPWNATTGTGGVVAIEATNTIFLNSNIDVSGRGFSGGQFMNFPAPVYDCSWAVDVTNYSLGLPPSPNNYYHGGRKGESISDYIAGMEYARGKQANGGGGGNNHNSGGAGGGNYGAGGHGGARSNESAFLCHGANSGRGATSLAGLGYTVANNRIFMGGGGGGGHQNNGYGMAGGNGGGIILLMANSIITPGATLSANGVSPINNICLDPTQAEGDGGGGGGAGGTILINATTVTGNLTVTANGARGTNASNRVSDCTGPGGGGGGGVFWMSGGSIPGNITATVTGGVNGTVSMGSNTIACRGQANGATAGSNGLATSGFVAPYASTALCWTLPAGELIQFDGRLSGDEIILTWTLKDENNLEKIILEKTVDQVRYNLVAQFETVKAAMQYADQQLPPDIAFYRLKLLRKNGTIAYSPVIAVQPAYTEPFSVIRLHPNPVVSELQVELFVQQQKQLRFYILGTTGTQIFSHTATVRRGYNTVSIPVATLPAGLYLIKAEIGTKQAVFRFIKK